MNILTALLLLLQGAVLDGAQSKPAPAAAAAQDPDRPALSPAELKALRDTNIFAPKAVRRTPPSSSPRNSGSTFKAAPAKPKPPLVTGIFFDAKAACFLVVVEDRNEASLKLFKEPKFLKAGDEVAGFKVDSVAAEKAVFIKGDVSKEIRVGEPLPGADGKSVSDASASPDAEGVADGEETESKPSEAKTPETTTKTLDPATHTQVLEQMRKKRGKKDRPGQDE